MPSYFVERQERAKLSPIGRTLRNSLLKYSSYFLSIIRRLPFD
jgi:hypothetical protein